MMTVSWFFLREVYNTESFRIIARLRRYRYLNISAEVPLPIVITLTDIQACFMSRGSDTVASASYLVERASEGSRSCGNTPVFSSSLLILLFFAYGVRRHDMKL